MSTIQEITKTEKALRRALANTHDNGALAISSYYKSLLSNKQNVQAICEAFEGSCTEYTERQHGTIVVGLFHWWIMGKLEILTK